MKLPLILSGGLLALVLTACGGDDPDDPAASATPSAPSSSATVSEKPSPTFDPKEETAKEFIRRWIRLGNEMQQTGETDEYLAITSGKCRSCNQFAERIEGIYEAGGWVKTKGERIVSIEHDGKAQWSVVVRALPTKYLERGGGSVESLPGGRVRYVTYILRDGDGEWVMTDYLQRAT